jgi:hypothetical protein
VFAAHFEIVFVTFFSFASRFETLPAHHLTFTVQKDPVASTFLNRNVACFLNVPKGSHRNYFFVMNQMSPSTTIPPMTIVVGESDVPAVAVPVAAVVAEGTEIPPDDDTPACII